MLLNALSNALLLCAACEAASPESVCAARSEEIFASWDAATAELCLLAAAAMDACSWVAGTGVVVAEAMAPRPARRASVKRIVVEWKVLVC